MPWPFSRWRKPQLIATTPETRIEPRPMKISDEALSYAREVAERSRIGAERHALFTLPEPPPGVIPADKQSEKIAQDDALSDYMSFGVNASGLSSGIQWLGYAFLSELAQRPEYRVISETYAKEMTRKWISFETTGDDDKTEKIKEIEEEFRLFGIRDHFRECIMLDGLMGIGHLYIDIDGVKDKRDELELPLIADKRKIKKGEFRGLIRVEPIWTYPATYNANDPLRNDFFRPQSWYVMAKKVHKSRLLTMVSREVPDFIKPIYSFGGLSLTQMSMPYVNNWLETRQSVNQIIDAFSVMVICTNLSATLNGGATDMLYARAEMFNNMRSNRGLFMIDKETEDFKNVSASLASLDLLQAQSQEHMASVSQIPLVKLLGVTPSGLNASSDGEIRTFYDNINAIQEAIMRSPLETVLQIIQLNKYGEIDPEITFNFNPLWQLDEAGEAAVEKTEADVDEQYANMGAVSSEEIRMSLARRRDSRYAGLDLDKPLPDPLPGEMDEDGNIIDDRDTNQIDAASVRAGGGGASGAASGV